MHRIGLAYAAPGCVVPEKKIRAKQKCVSRLAIDLLRDAIRAQANLFGHQDDHWGTVVDLMLIQLALIVGQHDDKPMSATKVSQYLGLPRTTIIRKLSQLVELDVVERVDGNRYRVKPSYLDSTAMHSVFNESARLIQRSAPLLSKTDA